MRRSQDEEVNEMAVWEEGKARDDADTTDEAATGVREGSVHKSERLRAGMRRDDRVSRREVAVKVAATTTTTSELNQN